MGTWTSPEESVDIMVHAAMTYTGKVLMWGVAQGMWSLPAPYNYAQLYDPIADTVTDVPSPFAHDMVCGGESILSNGKILFTGGAIVPVSYYGTGIVNSALFDPKTETWSQTGNMNYARWYPTNIELPNGEMLTTSGHTANAQQVAAEMEEYNPTTGTWTLLPPSANNPDPGNNYLFPRMDLLPNGQIFMSAPYQTSYTFNPATNAWTKIGNMQYGDRYYAGHLLLPNSYTVMLVDGTPTNANGGTGYTATTESIDLSAAKPVWTYGASMNIGRYNAIVAWLADGSAIAVGGNQGDTQDGKYGAPVETPEIYDFATQTWTEMNPQVGVRAYHSVGVLLPDGRFFSAGSTSNTTYDHDYEIFSPPYLYNGTRPTITGSPASVQYGQQFTITTPDASTISSVALIMPGATTHANDMQERYVPLTFSTGSGSLTATAPSTANYAPPGYYMLVIVNNNGVPSVMPFVQVGVTG
ncbi:MAG TPA: galactose oxidase-like domain-containing protein [Terriglobia bacterium]|nr:galactose oxidase-like domain-containing protein [Terriglobia bacterium]